jgi:HK97 family phage prohead protease
LRKDRGGDLDKEGVIIMDIVRQYSGQVEGLTLQRGDNAQRKIRGVASVYFDGTAGTTYDLSENIVERIAPGAFDSLLQDDVIACVDHDGKLIVGRNKANMKLWSSPRGLEYEIDLANTTAANDLWSNVTAGIIRGSSFKATLKMNDKNCVEWTRDGSKDVLTIKKFDRLKDVSCVSDPAYRGTDCSAIQRSLDQYKLDMETIKRVARMQIIGR